MEYPMVPAPAMPIVRMFMSSFPFDVPAPCLIALFFFHCSAFVYNGQETVFSQQEEAGTGMTPEAFWKTYDIGLNAQQRAAVEAVEGPVLLLAVPGSGKTTTLVIRLGYLVLVHGIAPEHILTLTYTVSAAADMKERFRKIFGDTLADRMHFRTINGVCALIIASFGRQIGKSTYTLLTDESRTAPLLRKIYQDV
ncbi:MAG TPA: hypothetical protein DGX96_05860, partial [Lachnospiraceae bacterium]|nr:hypothetical protein [Lachnospiraceae bacterium]